MGIYYEDIYKTRAAIPTATAIPEKAVCTAPPADEEDEGLLAAVEALEAALEIPDATLDATLLAPLSADETPLDAPDTTELAPERAVEAAPEASLAAVETAPAAPEKMVVEPRIWVEMALPPDETTETMAEVEIADPTAEAPDPTADVPDPTALLTPPKIVVDPTMAVD